MTNGVKEYRAVANYDTSYTVANPITGAQGAAWAAGWGGCAAHGLVVWTGVAAGASHVYIVDLSDGQIHSYLLSYDDPAPYQWLIVACPK
jgi:hypothetical protein